MMQLDERFNYSLQQLGKGGWLDFVYRPSFSRRFSAYGRVLRVDAPGMQRFVDEMKKSRLEIYYLDENNNLYPSSQRVPISDLLTHKKVQEGRAVFSFIEGPRYEIRLLTRNGLTTSFPTSEVWEYYFPLTNSENAVHLGTTHLYVGEHRERLHF